MSPIEPTRPPQWSLADLTPEQVFQLGEAWGMARASFESADEACDRLKLTLDRSTAERLRVLAEQAGLKAELTNLAEATAHATLTRGAAVVPVAM